MKFSNLNRIYINTTLTKNGNIELSGEQMHYIKTVLRLKINDRFRVFNSIDGEFIAQIIEITKNNLFVNITNHLRVPYVSSSLTLGIAIIKPEKFLLAVNTAVQLGVTKIVPLVTERCQSRSINNARLIKCVIEATEQSERLNLPIIEPVTNLQDYLGVNTKNYIIYANEHENHENSMLKALPSVDVNISCSSIIFIVGPEGGFTTCELENFTIYKNTKSISLGAYVLRTEVAVAAGLAQIGLLRNNIN
jgi:16S rRNA (uracil1498-N3)-methyltransferase